VTLTTPARRYDRLFVGALPLLLLAGGLGAWAWWDAREVDALAAAEATAREEVDPVKARMDAAAASPPDIDTTIRVVHEIDRALADHHSMRAYLASAAAQDYRGVAPDVLQARQKILDVLFRLYALQTQADEKDELYAVSAEYLLKTMSLVELQGGLSPATSVKVDKEQAQKLLEQLRQEKAEHARVANALRGEEAALYEAVATYAETLRPHLEAWDKLCLLRDRARLAARNGDWPAARAAAEAAIAMSPSEQEAHLLAAQAILAGGTDEDLPRAEALLQEVLDKHPDESAPALLLLGVLERRRGDEAKATLAFQQSAAMYPKQAARLSDMLDPYKQRAFLDQSREGSWILESYRSTMVGAGYYSPDLQLAKGLFDSGNFESGKQHVLEHFGRRRAQAQWDFLLSDIQFCVELLGEDWRAIFPEDAWLDLVVDAEMLGDGITLAIDNRSGRTLRNATLVLAIQYTDMLPGQYRAVAAERTLPAVLPRESTDFGRLDIDTEWLGKPKTRADVVQHRAVLLSDDAVVWVDTDAFKMAEAKAFREAGRAPANPGMATRMDTLARDAGRAASVAAVTRLGEDGVVLKLPRGLSILAPVFTLEYAGRTITATKNVIEADEIVLDFRGLANFEAADASLGDLVLTVGSVFGERKLRWSPAGGMAWRFVGVE
jgi:tetratricopeptide (TPR) repeat protein